MHNTANRLRDNKNIRDWREGLKRMSAGRRLWTLSGNSTVGNSLSREEWNLQEPGKHFFCEVASLPSHWPHAPVGYFFTWGPLQQRGSKSWAPWHLPLSFLYLETGKERKESKTDGCSWEWDFQGLTWRQAASFLLSKATWSHFGQPLQNVM